MIFVKGLDSEFKNQLSDKLLDINCRIRGRFDDKLWEALNQKIYHGLDFELFQDFRFPICNQVNKLLK